MVASRDGVNISWHFYCGGWKFRIHYSEHYIQQPNVQQADPHPTMPKAVSPLDPAARQSRRHNPLHQELIESGGGSGGNLRKVARTKRTKERQERSTAD